MNRKELGAKLKELRNRKKMSIAEVSRAVGVTQSAISNYETGYRIPRDETKIKLANLYGVSAIIFFET